MFCCRTVILLLALSIALSESASVPIQPKQARGPPPHDDNVSILDMLGSELESASIDTVSLEHPVCKFPPKAVLHELKTYSFFEICNRKVPSHLTPHSPDEDVLCMGLYELGLRLCSFATKYHLPLSSIPSNASDFKELLANLNRTESDSSLCSEFEKLPPPQFLEKQNVRSQVDDWNILAIFKKNPRICQHICYYYNGDANVLCKLIVWGNKLMRNATPASNNSQIKPVLSSVDIVADDYSQGNTEIGVESHESRDDLNFQPKDSPSSTIVSSQDSTSALKKTQTEIIDMGIANIKVGSSSRTDSSKITLVAVAAEGEKHESVQVEPLAGLSLSTHQLIVASGNEDDVEPKTSKLSKSIVENVKQLQTEKTIQELNEKKLDEGHDAKKSEVHLPKDTKVPTTASSSALPVTLPTVSVPDVIVQDTASIPSTGANEEPRVDDFSHYDDQGEDDVHFPAVEMDQPIKADENINGGDDFQSRGDMKYVHDRFEESEDSHFFRYFMTMVVFCIFGYLLFHNKQKILALFLEGRSRRSNRRRPNTANYHKLDSNLEEAVSSPCNTSVAHVIY